MRVVCESCSWLVDLMEYKSWPWPPEKLEIIKNSDKKLPEELGF